MSDRDPVPLRFSFWRAGVMLVICTDLVLVATICGRIRLVRSSSKLHSEQTNAALWHSQQKTAPESNFASDLRDWRADSGDVPVFIAFVRACTFASIPVPRYSVTYVTLQGCF